MICKPQNHVWSKSQTARRLSHKVLIFPLRSSARQRQVLTRLAPPPSPIPTRPTTLQHPPCFKGSSLTIAALDLAFHAHYLIRNGFLLPFISKPIRRRSFDTHDPHVTNFFYSKEEFLIRKSSQYFPLIIGLGKEKIKGLQ